MCVPLDIIQLLAAALLPMLCQRVVILVVIYYLIVCISAPVFDSTISILFFVAFFFSFHILIFYIPRIIGTPLSADGSDVHAV